MKIQPGVGYNFDSSDKGFTLDTSDPFPSSTKLPVSDCPFTIVDRSEDGVYQFSCVPGMVNSIIPQIGTVPDSAKRLDQIPTPTTTFNFDAEGYSFIYLKVSADYSTPPTIYPVNDQTDILYPRIISNSVQQSASDDSAFFLLAVAYKEPETTTVVITQLTCGSQWSDRIKVGSAVAKYFFARS